MREEILKLLSPSPSAITSLRNTEWWRLLMSSTAMRASFACYTNHRYSSTILFATGQYLFRNIVDSDGSLRDNSGALLSFMQPNEQAKIQNVDLSSWPCNHLYAFVFDASDSSDVLTSVWDYHFVAHPLLTATMERQNPLIDTSPEDIHIKLYRDSVDVWADNIIKGASLNIPLWDYRKNIDIINTQVQSLPLRELISTN